MRRFTLAAVPLLVFALAVSLAAQNSQSKKTLKVIGTTRIGHARNAPSEIGTEVMTGPEVDVSTTKPQISGNTSPARVPAAHVPTPAGNALISGGGNNFVGFDGLTHLDQRLASGGNQFSLEPPDHGLAVSNNFVVEAVNDAVAVYSHSGALLSGPISVNQFLGLPPSIDRTKNPLVFGPYPADPRVYYDSATSRFFLTVTVLTLDQNENFVAPSTVYVAVSQTSDPTGAWTVLALDVTNDGGPFSPCPCFGDQPLLGADANGFYISTNAFNIATRSFAGGNIYAMSKAALESATSGPITAVRFGNLTEAEAPFAFSIQPATTAPGANNATNTEYFVSSLDFTNTVDNRLVVWALKGTNTLGSASPSLSLVNSVVDTQSYGAPPQMQQKAGPYPLGQSLKEHEELVASNDDRLQQVVLSGGNLWTSLTTSAKTTNGPVRAAAAYFILHPTVSSGQVSATVVNQGYVSINSPNQDNVVFPSIAVNANGQGLMGFSVVGTDFFPSAGYASIDAVNGAGPIHIAAAGVLPEDGFTGYFAFGGSRVARWGDYSAAVADPSGALWIANEYIPNAPRTANANWGTFISKVTP
jgi:hypothetical protein